MNGPIPPTEALVNDESDLSEMLDAQASAAEARRRELRRERELQEQHRHGYAQWHRHLQRAYLARAAEHARLAAQFGG